MDAVWECLRVSIDQKIGHIVLNRPEVFNALDYKAVHEFERAVHELEGQAKVILVEGAGDHFCAGADLRYLAETTNLREFIEQINRAFSSLEQAPVPVVAIVQGYALAGGFELMQACDVVIAAENAVIGDQHANVGLIPGGGGSQRLPRLVGRQRALALLLSGERITGRDAVSWGLAYKSVPPSELKAEGTRLAQELAAKSSGALRAMKHLVDCGAERPLKDAINLEVETFLEWIQNPDAQQGLRAFREKRAPEFS